jgi:hypothetical protein
MTESFGFRKVSISFAAKGVPVLDLKVINRNRTCCVVCGYRTDNGVGPGR